MKTNPIGVRFRADILEKLKTEHGAETPQKALNFLERFFVTHYALTRDLKQPLRSNAESNKASMKQSPIKEAEIDNSVILERIKAIRAEIRPEHRSKASWDWDQNKRIKELEKQLTK